MKLAISNSEAGGGYAEALSRNRMVNREKPVGDIHLCDASSQVANYRSAELFLAVWTAYQMSDVQITTDVISSGVQITTEKTDASYWSFQGLGGTQFFTPQASIVPNSTVRDKRLMYIREITHLLKNDLGNIRIENIHISDGADYMDMYLHTAIREIPNGSSLGTFACLACSTKDRVVTHALRKVKTGVALTELIKGSSVDCSGQVWMRQLVASNPTITEMIRRFGFTPGGKLFYATHQDRVNTNLVIRDYSNPRGTVAEVVARKPKRTFVSTRFYITNENTDAPIEKLLSAIQDNPLFFADVIRDYPVLSDGRVVHITI
jgi:hypothetical protein